MLAALACAGEGEAPPRAEQATAGTDERDRLTVFNNNGRVEHWEVALDQWRADELKGGGAGTFQHAWNRGRTGDFQYWGALFGGVLNPAPAEE